MIKKLLISQVLLLCSCQDVYTYSDSELSCSQPQSSQPAKLQATSSQTNCQTIVLSVKFSPRGGAAENIINAIDEAKDNIRVQAYSFTSASIATSLIKAKDRGVDVQVILDSSDRDGRGTQFKNLVSSGMNVYVDGIHQIAHNKVIIIDKKIVFTGSYNFSASAEISNAENSIEILDTKLAETYLQNWELHKSHSPMVLK